MPPQPSPSIPSPGMGIMPGMPRNTSYNATSTEPPPYDQQPTANFPNQPPAWAGNQASVATTPHTRYDTPPAANPSARSPGPDQSGQYFASSVAGTSTEKRAAPPVPIKRTTSAQAQYVTALFDFEAQNPGDLGFREGDTIKVIKKTESTDDWWDGELRGKVGAFPANYVQQ